MAPIDMYCQMQYVIYVKLVGIEGEKRLQTLSMVGRVLFVVYTERGKEKLQWVLSHRQ